MAIFTPHILVSQLTASIPNMANIELIKPKSWELNIIPNTIATATAEVTYGKQIEARDNVCILISAEFNAYARTIPIINCVNVPSIHVIKVFDNDVQKRLSVRIHLKFWKPMYSISACPFLF